MLVHACGQRHLCDIVSIKRSRSQGHNNEKCFCNGPLVSRADDQRRQHARCRQIHSDTAQTFRREIRARSSIHLLKDEAVKISGVTGRKLIAFHERN